MMIMSGTNYHYVKNMVADTNGNGVLKLTLNGDPEVSHCQFNRAEVLIFLDNEELVMRLIEAINGASDAQA